MERFIVVHYHEVALKGGNRDYFENRLVHHISKALAVSGCGAGPVRRIWGRILIEVPPEADVALIKDQMSRVFGVANFAEAWNSGQTLKKWNRTPGN